MFKFDFEKIKSTVKDYAKNVWLVSADYRKLFLRRYENQIRNEELDVERKEFDLQMHIRESARKDELAELTMKSQKKPGRTLPQRSRKASEHPPPRAQPTMLLPPSKLSKTESLKTWHCAADKTLDRTKTIKFLMPPKKKQTDIYNRTPLKES